MPNPLSEKIAKLLPLQEEGFYDVTYFADEEVGFSFKKDFGDRKYVSLFHLIIDRRKIQDDGSKKPLIIAAVYGERTGDGVRVRSLTSKELRNPIDLDFYDEYYFDIDTDKFYARNTLISPRALLSDIYSKHILPTKLLRGLPFRLRYRLWKFWVPKLLGFIYWLLQKILFVVSGDRYAYRHLFKEETLNDEIIDSRFPERIGELKPKGRLKEKSAKSIQFFGMSVPQWPIVFYSAIHLSLVAWYEYNYLDIGIIDTVIGNNFYVVCYVIVSFWLVETLIPLILKFLIKRTSILSSWSEYRKIHI